MMQAKAETISAEQAADLAALTAAANEAEAVPGEAGAGGPGAPVNVPDLGEELGALLKVAVATLGPAFPSLKTIYTPETIGAAAGAIAGVCQKHGWLQGGVMGEYAEEITALAIVGPLALATYQGIKGDIAARAKKDPDRIESAPEVNIPDAPKTVTFGAVAPAKE